MEKNIRDGATIYCTLGTCKSKLIIPKEKNARIN